MSGNFSSRSYASSPTENSSINSSFLTPPVTPQSQDDIPYKPDKTDQTSLNLKKSKKLRKGKSKATQRRYRQQQDVAHSNDVEAGRSHKRIDLVRSKSLCTMGYVHSGDVSPGSTRVLSSHAEDVLPGARRWTLPSKSSPTRAFTALRSTVRQATLNGGSDSPAMITLRRATTSASVRKTPKEHKLTFFPEPNFSYERSKLLSYLVSTFSKASPDSGTGDLYFTGLQRFRTPSIGSDGAHPVMTYPAATVYTEATVEPNLTIPGFLPSTMFARRCSTRYITGSSSFEIIWDENDSATTSQGSSRPSVSDRRSSVAVTTLKSQLANSSQTTRRCSGKRSSQASASSISNSHTGALTHETLEQIFPRLVHKIGLRNLPTSRTGKRRSSTVCTVTSTDAEYITMFDNSGRKASLWTIDFWPPLDSRKASLTPAPTSGLEQAQDDHENHTADVNKSTQLRSDGGSFGTSGRTRFRSSVTPYQPLCRSKNSAKPHARKYSVGILERRNFKAGDDTQPLLISSNARCDGSCK